MLSDNVQVLKAERESSLQSVFRAILEEETSTISRVVELVVSVLLVTEKSVFFLIHLHCQIFDFFVRQRARMRQVLHTIRAAAVRAAQDDNVVLTGRNVELYVGAIIT